MTCDPRISVKFEQTTRICMWVLQLDQWYVVILEYACEYYNIPLVKFCLEYGLKADDGIILKVLKKFHIPIIKLFLEYNVDFSKKE